MKTKLVIGIFLGILYMPAILFGVRALSGKKADVELKGYFDEVPVPQASVDSIVSGEFQGSFTNWFNAEFPPRGVLIKTYNSLRFDLFGLANNIIGEDRYIYEYAYVSSELMLEPQNNMAITESREKLEDYVMKLQAVRDALRAQGKGFVFYISASKADMCRDRLPKSYLVQEAKDGIRSVDYLKELLTKTDIDWFYAPDIATDLPCKPFYSTGIHWSRPFEQKVTLEVLRRVGMETGETYRSWELTELKTQKEPFSRDCDVFDTMNIWEPPFEDAYYEYDTQKVIPEEYDHLNILMQGGSFAHGVWGDVWAHYPEEKIQYINYCEYLYN
ncbi:MAG: hypothetical protein J6M27_09175, partial [Lachnospiraceae bacterium]|nr:hypothetical protein [Lachnospiraceae bacterium]